MDSIETKIYTLKFSSIALSAVYFFVAFIFTGIDSTAATLTMTISLFVFLNYIWDSKMDLFSFYDWFIVAFFVWGIFFRYILVASDNTDILPKAFPPAVNIPDYHFETSLYVLLAVVSLAIGIISYRCMHGAAFIVDKKVQNEKFALYLEKYNGYWSVLKVITVLLGIVSLIYKITNIRLATAMSFGNYDNVINMIYRFCQFGAFISLKDFFVRKKKAAFLLSMLILVPEIIIGILSAYKSSTIMFVINIAIVMASVNYYNKKLITKYVVVIGALLYFIIPIISMQRINLALGTEHYTIGLNSIIQYNNENNVVRYFSDRFSYYDYIYYITHLNEGVRDIYIDVVGREHDRFLAGIVPRLLNPEKKVVGLGEENTHYLFGYPSYIYTNSSISYVMSAWLSYGIFGIFAVSAIIGFLLCKLETLKNKLPWDMGKYMVYGTILYSCTEGGLVGSLINFLGAYVLINIVLLLRKN